MKKRNIESNEDFNHPKNDVGRFVCSAAFPMPENRPKDSRWVHADAVLVAEDYGRGGGVADGDFELYKCPYCGLSFWVELPN